MSRFSAPWGSLLAGLLVASSLASPVAARRASPPASAPVAADASQSAGVGGEKMNMVIIYGDDKCPTPVDDEITVCARKDEGERYRIPAPFRNSVSSQDESWTNRVVTYERVSATGTQSCSPVGAGGWTGCEGQFIKNAYAEKKAATDVNFSRMIEEARAKRAATIDADAAATQARVEAAEKAYLSRKDAQDDKAEQDAANKAGK